MSDLTSHMPVRAEPARCRIPWFNGFHASLCTARSRKRPVCRHFWPRSVERSYPWCAHDREETFATEHGGGHRGRRGRHMGRRVAVASPPSLVGDGSQRGARPRHGTRERLRGRIRTQTGIPRLRRAPTGPHSVSHSPRSARGGNSPRRHPFYPQPGSASPARGQRKRARPAPSCRRRRPRHARLRRPPHPRRSGTSSDNKAQPPCAKVSPTLGRLAPRGGRPRRQRHRLKRPRRVASLHPDRLRAR